LPNKGKTYRSGKIRAGFVLPVTKWILNASNMCRGKREMQRTVNGLKNFEDVYEAYFRPVYRYILSLCSDSHLAEEVTQRAFWSAYRHFKDFEGKSDVSTWLCRIAKNELLQMKRRKGFHSLGEAEKNIPSSDAPPESAIGDRQEAERIQRIVHTMVDPYKEVFLLRVYGEFDYARIAALFSKSESWARVTYYRAKQKIWEQMEKEDAHE